jgi:hypothetical protein
MKLLSTFSMNTVFATIAGLGLLAATPLAVQSSLLQTNARAQCPASSEQDRGSGRMAAQDSGVHAALVGWRGSGRIGTDSEGVS